MVRGVRPQSIPALGDRDRACGRPVAAEVAVALLRAVTAGALATLVPGAGNCAPRDEVIEDALEGGVGN